MQSKTCRPALQVQDRIKAQRWRSRLEGYCAPPRTLYCTCCKDDSDASLAAPVKLQCKVSIQASRVLIMRSGCGEKHLCRPQDWHHRSTAPLRLQAKHSCQAEDILHESDLSVCAMTAATAQAALGPSAQRCVPHCCLIPFYIIMTSQCNLQQLWERLTCNLRTQGRPKRKVDGQSTPALL